MKRSIFGVYQFDEVVGTVVLACVGVFVAVLINAGVCVVAFRVATARDVTYGR